MSTCRYEVYMRWSLEELTVGTSMGSTAFNPSPPPVNVGGDGASVNKNWGNVTKATLRLYTASSTGPTHIYVQHLNDTGVGTWGDAGGTTLAWHTR